MSLSKATIDLISQKIELDAFLSKCLEMQIREDAPKVSPQPLEDIRMKDSGVIEGDCLDRPVPVEPVLDPEPVEIAGPVTEEVPSVQADKEYVKPAHSPAVPVDSAGSGADTGAEEKQPPFSQEKEAGEPLHHEIESAQIHFGSEEQENKPLITANVADPEPPQAVAPVTDMDTKPDLSQARPDPKPQLPAELRSPYRETRSSLRKPSKNAGAMAYAQESDKKKKRLLVAVGIFVAFLIGVAVYLYISPEIGIRSAEIVSGKPNVTTSSQEQERARAADSKVDAKSDSKSEEGRQIHKKITRGGT